MTKDNKDMVEDKREVKISTCPVCNGIIRAAGAEYLQTDKDAKKEFFKEVSKHNLNVSTISLTDYRTSKPQWCSCIK